MRARGGLLIIRRAVESASWLEPRGEGLRRRTRRDGRRCALALLRIERDEGGLLN